MNKSFLAALLTATSLGTSAQTTDLGELNVQAGSADSRLPEFSTSSTVIDAGTIDDREAHHFQDAIGMVPNLSFAGGTSRPRYFQLRGIGENSQFAGEGPPNFSVGFLVDDIDLSGLGMSASLFDVQSVEVLRGPQATIYGSKALAGLININTKAPTPYRDNNVQLSVGTDEYIEVGLATGGSLKEEDPTWMYRFAFNWLNSNGYRKNEFLDRDNTNGRTEFNTRLKFRHQPDDETLVDYTILAARINNGYDAFATRGDGFTMFTDEPGEDDQDVLGASVRATMKDPEGFDLVSITSGSHVESVYSYDADWGNDAFWLREYGFDPAIEGYAYSFAEELQRRRQSASQEFRFQGEEDNKLFGISDWSAGVAGSWLREEDDYVGFDTLISDYEATTVAGFGQLTTALAGNLNLITSVRVENRETDYEDDRGNDLTTSDTMVGGRASLELDISDTSSAFATISRGFKGAGVNQAAQVPDALREYDPEYVWNYEAGVRSLWAEGRGQGSITVFYMDRDDLQITSSVQTDPTDPTAFGFFTDNAAEGKNYGFEAELRQPICASATFFGSLGFLETEYSDFADAGGSNNIEGREQPYAPAYTFLAGLDVDLGDGWFVRTEIEGKDSFFFADGHDQKSKPYELVNFKLGYQAELWSVSLWGRNVFDKSYDTRGFFFGNEPPDFPSRTWTMKGDPAQFGITFRGNF